MSINAVSPVGSASATGRGTINDRNAPETDVPAKPSVPDRVELSSLAREATGESPKLRLSMAELRELVSGPPESPRAAERPSPSTTASTSASDVKSAARHADTSSRS